MQGDVPTPEGVELWDPHDSVGMRGMIERDTLDALKRYVHGFEYGGVRLELDDLSLHDKPEYTKDEQREALLNDKTVARRVRGTVRLVDNQTGEILDQKKNHTLLRIPWLTERGTFIHAGTSYAPISQSRLLAGPYTRRRDDGTVECHINVRPGTGKTMRVSMDPESAQYRVKVGGASGSADVHAYSLFNALGVPDSELEKRWGKDVLDMNRAKVDKNALDRFYEKAVSKWNRPSEAPTKEQKIEAVRSALDNTQVTESIMRENLPTLHDPVKAAAWRALGAVGSADMEKEAAIPFAPDLAPSELANAVAELDFDVSMSKAAFSPDSTPDQMNEAHMYLHCGWGPRLASMAAWPDHWLNDEDPTGWIEWYEKYTRGRRIPDDDRQIMRWKRFKRLHGAKFVANPTPRRAFALRNWAIDPLKMLPDSQREGMRKAMDSYRNVEFVKWRMSRHGFDDMAADRLLERAKMRGYKGDGSVEERLLDAADRGFITADDV